MAHGTHKSTLEVELIQREVKAFGPHKSNLASTTTHTALKLISEPISLHTTGSRWAGDRAASIKDKRALALRASTDVFFVFTLVKPLPQPVALPPGRHPGAVRRAVC